MLEVGFVESVGEGGCTMALWAESQPPHTPRPSVWADKGRPDNPYYIMHACMHMFSQGQTVDPSPALLVIAASPGLHHMAAEEILESAVNAAGVKPQVHILACPGDDGCVAPLSSCPAAPFPLHLPSKMAHSLVPRHHTTPACCGHVYLMGVYT